MLPCLGGMAGCHHADPCTGTVVHPYRPPAGCSYLFAGQTLAQIGGLPDAGDTDGYVNHVPVAPSGVTLYGAFPAPGDTTPLAQMSWVADAEALLNQPGNEDLLFHLSIAWVPESLADNQTGREAIETALLAGAFDPWLDQLADWISGLRQPVLLRLGYEFNRLIRVLYSQQYYAACFRHIVDRLRSRGIKGAAFVWASANMGFIPDAPTPDDWDFDAWYPGDDYVDWFGFSMWFPKDYDTIMLPQARAHHKPLLLAETTPSEFNVGLMEYFPFLTNTGQPQTSAQLWAGWWQPMISFVTSNDDVIGGWHYIAANWRDDPEWSSVPFFSNSDARLWLDPGLASAWSGAVSHPPFVQKGGVHFIR